MSSYTCLMFDIGPTWDAETISLLLGKPSPNENENDFRVELLEPSISNGKNDKSNNKTARLYFGSKDEMYKTISVYQGMVVPMTHGYHYYTFSADGGDGDGIDVGCDHNLCLANVTPPLHLQLMALPSKELEKRLNDMNDGDVITAANNHSKTLKGNRTCKVYKHASLAYHLSQAMGNDRPTKHIKGVPISKQSTYNELLEYLRSSADTFWPPSDKQRKGVSANNYLTVRKQHPPELDTIWNTCKELIDQAVVPKATYNALAITKGFRGSPHIDQHDKTFQYVIALGEFMGGELCAEADEDGKEVVAINVKGKFGRIDGRSVHWVSGWTGERYSIVYYSTSDDDYTEIVSQSVHTQWMESIHTKLTGNKDTGVIPQRRYANHPRLPSYTPILGLGCSSFSTFFSSQDEESLTLDTMSRDHPVVKGWIETIRHAVLNRGINLLDTAPWYGHGISETTVGYALDTILEDYKSLLNTSAPSKIQRRKRTGSLPRSSLIINTKVGRYEANALHQFDFSYDATLHSVHRSLERMNCTYIDVIQLHDPEFAPSISILLDETIPALLKCRKRGLAKAIGITGYPLEVQHQILVECRAKFGTDQIVFDQSLVYCHNNLHDMSLFNDTCFPSLDDDKDDNKIAFAEFCQQSNIHLMAAAPLSMGLLTNAGPPTWHPASTELKEACSAAAKLCESKGVNISSLALLYSLSQKVGCTLLGMKDMEQVDIAADLALRFCSDTDADGSHLSPQEEEALESVLDTSSAGPFSTVRSNGLYRWDGQAEAKKFRVLVDELKEGQE